MSIANLLGVGPGGDVLLHAGTGAALLFGIAAALIWAVVYAELGCAYPYAGGDYVAVGSILGPWAGLASFWGVTAGPSNAFQARVIANYFKDLVPGVSVAVITFLAMGLATGVALLAVRTSSRSHHYEEPHTLTMSEIVIQSTEKVLRLLGKREIAQKQ